MLCQFSSTCKQRRKKEKEGKNTLQRLRAINFRHNRGLKMKDAFRWQCFLGKTIVCAAFFFCFCAYESCFSFVGMWNLVNSIKIMNRFFLWINTKNRSWSGPAFWCSIGCRSSSSNGLRRRFVCLSVCLFCWFARDYYWQSNIIDSCEKKRLPVSSCWMA